MVTLVQCAALIAPYRSLAGKGNGYLGAGAGDRLVSVKDATAPPDCRCHIAPLTLVWEKGPTGAAKYLTDSLSA